MNRFLLLYLFFLLQIATSVEAQQETKAFVRINDSDGLPNNDVRAIFNDSKGFMWFGTAEGLCKFDGYEYHI